MAKDNTLLLIVGAILVIVLLVKFGPGLIPQQQAILYNCNVCDTNSAVLANEKLSCTNAGWSCSVANNCLTCTQGQDVNSCDDTDTHTLPTKNYMLAGHTTNVQHSVTTSIYDECVDATRLKEAYCTSFTGDGTPRSEVVSCGPGKICQSGRCVTGTCTPDITCGECNTQGFKVCDDGCGSSYTDTSGCCVPDCTNKCGQSNGCGGTCPACTSGCTPNAIESCTTDKNCAGKRICKSDRTWGLCLQSGTTCTTPVTTPTGTTRGYWCAFSGSTQSILGYEGAAVVCSAGEICVAKEPQFGAGICYDLVQDACQIACSKVGNGIFGGGWCGQSACTSFNAPSGGKCFVKGTYYNAVKAEDCVPCFANGHLIDPVKGAASCCSKQAQGSVCQGGAEPITYYAKVTNVSENLAPPAQPNTSVISGKCQYSITSLDVAGLKVTTSGDTTKCIPEGCPYFDSTSLPATFNSNCCDGLIKEEQGKTTVTFLGILPIVDVTRGTCEKETGVCALFGFIKDVLPEPQKDSACLIGFAGIFFFFFLLFLAPRR